MTTWLEFECCIILENHLKVVDVASRALEKPKTSGILSAVKRHFSYKHISTIVECTKSVLVASSSEAMRWYGMEKSPRGVLARPGALGRAYRSFECVR